MTLEEKTRLLCIKISRCFFIFCTKNKKRPARIFQLYRTCFPPQNSICHTARKKVRHQGRFLNDGQGYMLL